MKEINSKDNEKIKYVVKLINSKKYRERYKKFIIEGYKAIYDAYCFGLKADNVFIHSSKVQEFSFVENSKLVIVNENILKKISTTDSFSKSVAVFNKVDYNCDDLKNKKTIALFENIKDPGNFGTILRSANAFGVEGIILYGNTLDIYNPKVIRSSVGNFLKIPIVKINDLQTLKKMFSEYRFYATKVDAGVCLKKIKFEEKKVIMFGSEASGLSDELSKTADEFFTIKMKNKVESLNLSVAASIVFYSL